MCAVGTFGTHPLGLQPVARWSQAGRIMLGAGFSECASAEMASHAATSQGLHHGLLPLTERSWCELMHLRWREQLPPMDRTGVVTLSDTSVVLPTEAASKVLGASSNVL